MHQIRRPHWTERFQKSPYFLGAFLFHLIIGSFFAFYIVFPAPKVREPDPTTIILPIFSPVSEPPREESLPGDKSEETALPSVSPATIPIPHHLEMEKEIMRVDHGGAEPWVVAKAEISSNPIESISADVQQKSADLSKNGEFKNNQDRKAFIQQWYSESEQSSSQRVASFTIYVGKVSGLNSRRLISNENGIEGGPMANLVAIAESWGRQTMKPKLSSKLIDLADESLIDKAPPFIFLSGSQDFTLTEKEILNIREYLRVGGAIWADNGLAGIGSRFDIAFRREMKRVVGAVDFEVLPIDHPLFQGPKALLQITSIPEGMNYRNDPIEIVKVGGEIGIIYTPNNYTDMMRMVFQAPLKFKGNEPVIYSSHEAELRQKPTTPMGMWLGRENYFRNFEPESCEQVFRVGVNLIFHLLSRWQDRLG